MPEPTLLDRFRAQLLRAYVGGDLPTSPPPPRIETPDIVSQPEGSWPPGKFRPGISFIPRPESVAAAEQDRQRKYEEIQRQQRATASPEAERLRTQEEWMRAHPRLHPRTLEYMHGRPLTPEDI